MVRRRLHGPPRARNRPVRFVLGVVFRVFFFAVHRRSRYCVPRLEERFFFPHHDRRPFHGARRAFIKMIRDEIAVANARAENRVSLCLRRCRCVRFLFCFFVLSFSWCIGVIINAIAVIYRAVYPYTSDDHMCVTCLFFFSLQTPRLLLITQRLYDYFRYPFRRVERRRSIIGIYVYISP